jgi:hypothetical protein
VEQGGADRTLTIAMVLQRLENDFGIKKDAIDTYDCMPTVPVAFAT